MAERQSLGVLPAGDVASRFWEKVDQSGGPTACWPWTATLFRLGYGQFSVGGSAKLAHRVAWELIIGPIPDGAELDHECHNRDQTCNAGDDCLHRRCVNPAHLAPKTHRANSLAGRSFAAENARKTHCPKGHEYTPENTMLINPGRGRPRARRCRTCDRANARKRQQVPAVRAQRNEAQNARLQDPEYRAQLNAKRRARAALLRQGRI